ncbi:hypothetical protein [Prochlorococcus marinus]|uniref:hypothetical protein n=1 Tax=Prochlorococcus marinus TaxID=1219 RepID=UPI0007B35B65|nr:hypothetical protein [Prochlorococcus marinus]
MVADLQGFTALTRQRSEQGRVRVHLEQPNHYLDEMRSVVWDHHGFLDKLIADVVMAVVGCPMVVVNLRKRNPLFVVLWRCVRGLFI